MSTSRRLTPNPCVQILRVLTPLWIGHPDQPSPSSCQSGKMAPPIFKLTTGIFVKSPTCAKVLKRPLDLVLVDLQNKTLPLHLHLARLDLQQTLQRKIRTRLFHLTLLRRVKRNLRHHLSKKKLKPRDHLPVHLIPTTSKEDPSSRNRCSISGPRTCSTCPTDALPGQPGIRIQNTSILSPKSTIQSAPHIQAYDYRNVPTQNSGLMIIGTCPFNIVGL